MYRLKQREAPAKLFTLLMAVLAAMMVCMDISQPWGSDYATAAAEVLSNLQLSLYGTAFEATLLAAGFYCLGCRLTQTKLPGRWAAVLLSALVGLIWLCGACYIYGGGLGSITASYGQLLKSAIYFLGASWLIYTLLKGLYFLLTEPVDISLKPCRLTAFLSKHCFGAATIFLLLCWAVPTAVCYPGAVANDSWVQLSQFFGLEQFTSHHPPLHTLIMGAFCSLGVKLGSPNLGAYLFILLQTLLSAFVMAYAVTLLKRLTAPRWISLLALITAGFSPFVANTVGTLLKDLPYDMAVLLLVIELIYALLDLKVFLGSKRHWLLSALAIIGVALLRNNGKYVLYPTLAVVLIVLLVKRKSLGKKPVAQGLALVLLPVILAALINTAMFSAFNITKGSVAEALSLPFQQTARYVTYYGDEVTDEEQAAIDAILPYDRLSELYNPAISDPVKAEYNQSADTQQLLTYFKTWFRMFLKHPTVYFEATIAQNYPLVDPFVENRVVYMGFSQDSGVAQTIGLEEPEALSAKKDIVTQWFLLMYSSPFIGVLSNTAPYTVAALFIFILAIAKRHYSLLIPTLPIIISIAVIIAAPVIMNHPRYAFPIIYSLPLLLGYFSYLDRA